jgi:hypothetical protein
MGWGFVDDSAVDRIVGYLEGTWTPPDKADAAAYLEAWYDVRTQVWDLRQRE